MTIPPAIKEIIANQVVFEDGRTLPKVIEAIFERLDEIAETKTADEKGSDNNGI